MKTKVKSIITQYAMSSGIFVSEGETDGDGMLSVKGRGFLSSSYFHNHKFSKNWHTAKDTAVADVKTRAEKKRKSLEKQIAGLDKKLQKALAAIEAADLTPPAPESVS